jgi:hypothetical protein
VPLFIVNWCLAVAANGQQYSCSESDIAALVQAGQIHAQTLMWREGLKEWIPAGSALPDVFRTAPSAAATQSMNPRAPQTATRPPSGAIAPGGQRPEANVVRFVSQPLMMRKGWIKFFGVISILYGILTLIPLGWMLIWAGVSVLKGIGGVDAAQRSGDPKALAQANDAFGRAFVLQAVTWLISVVVAVVAILLFGAAVVAGLREDSNPSPSGETQMESPQRGTP